MEYLDLRKCFEHLPKGETLCKIYRRDGSSYPAIVTVHSKRKIIVFPKPDMDDMYSSSYKVTENGLEYLAVYTWFAKTSPEEYKRFLQTPTHEVFLKKR